MAGEVLEFLTVAKVNRRAAMTRDGASCCANRIKMEEVETARMAVVSAKGRIKRCRGWAIRPFYRRSNFHARGAAVV